MSFSSWGSIINWMLGPFYIYECSKASRGKKVVWPRTMICRTYGMAPATIESETLWKFGIATHLIDAWDSKDDDGNNCVDWLFWVPSTMHFLADVVMRQRQAGMGFEVMSPVVKKGNQYSHYYQNKQYKPVGVPIKHKSWTIRIALLFFGDKMSKRVKKGKKR